MILNKQVYLLMVDIDPDVMNMFTQDYGLTADELTRVNEYYFLFLDEIACIAYRVGHRLMTIILSNLSRFRKISHWKIS